MQEPSSTGVEPVSAGLCVIVPTHPLQAAACFWQAVPQTCFKNGNIHTSVR